MQGTEQISHGQIKFLCKKKKKKKFRQHPAALFYTTESIYGKRRLQVYSAKTSLSLSWSCFFLIFILSLFMLSESPSSLSTKREALKNV